MHKPGDYAYDNMNNEQVQIFSASGLKDYYSLTDTAAHLPENVINEGE